MAENPNPYTSILNQTEATESPYANVLKLRDDNTALIDRLLGMKTPTKQRDYIYYPPNYPTQEERDALRESLTGDDVNRLAYNEKALLAEHLGITDWTEIPGMKAGELGKYTKLDISRGYGEIADIPVTEFEWFTNELINANWSVDSIQGIVDMGSLFIPWGERQPGAEGNEERWFGGGTLFPNLQNMFAFFNELGLLGASKIPVIGDVTELPFKVAQVFERGAGNLPMISPEELKVDHTPHVDAFWEIVKSKYDTSNPEVRKNLGKFIHNHPMEFMTDILGATAIGAGTLAGTTKVGVGVMRHIATRTGKRMPRITKKLEKVQAGMDELDGVTQRVNQILNRGWELPDSPAWVQLLFTNRGLADIADPTMMLGFFPIAGTAGASIAALSNAMMRIFRRTPLDPNQLGYIDQETRAAMIRLGIDPRRASISAQSADPQIAFVEATKLKEADIERIEAMIYTVEQLNAKIKEQVNNAASEASYDEMAAVIKAGYEDVLKKQDEIRNSLYEDIDGVMDAPMVFEAVPALLADMAAEDEVLKLSINPTNVIDQVQDYPPELGRFTRRVAEVLPDPSDLRNAPEGGEFQPPPPTNPSTGQNLGAVETNLNNHGTPARVAYSPDYSSTYDVTYGVVDIGKAIPSHESYLANSPRTDPELYNPDLQPKEIDIYAQGIIEKRAGQLKPVAMLNDTSSLATGAPILTLRNEIAAGNHRYFYLLRALHAYPERWADYQRMLRVKAPDYGIDPAMLEDMENPILVRYISDDVDVVEVARQSNERETGGMGQSTQATHDAYYLTDDHLAGLKYDRAHDSIENVIQYADNADWTIDLINKLDENQRKEYQTDGVVNVDGIKAISNMILRKTFQGEYSAIMLKTFLETKRAGTLNIRRGILNAGAPIAKLELEIRAGRLENDYSIAEHLAQAAWKIGELRKEGTSITDFQNQGTLAGIQDITPIAKDLMPIVARAIRTPSDLSDFLIDYIKEVSQESAEANPLFADPNKPPLDQQAIIIKLLDKYTDDGTANQSIDELMDAAQRQAGDIDDDAAESNVRKGQVDLTIAEEPPKPYTYAQAKAARTRFRRKKEQNDPQKKPKRQPRPLSLLRKAGGSAYARYGQDCGHPFSRKGGSRAEGEALRLRSFNYP